MGAHTMSTSPPLQMQDKRLVHRGSSRVTVATVNTAGRHTAHYPIQRRMSKSVLTSVAGATVLEGVTARVECTEAIFDKRDSLVTGFFSFSRNFCFWWPSSWWVPSTIKIMKTLHSMLTYSHVDYITSVESKEVSIPEGERLNFS